jgi:hypothetical protein
VGYFNESLGVQCNYGHIERDGRFDFGSDDKREKRVARQMILLRDSMNVVLPAIVGKPAGAGPTAGEGHPAMPIRQYDLSEGALGRSRGAL